MSKQIRNNARFVSGISDFVREGAEATYAFGRSVDHRTDPKSIKLLPRSIKESGNVVIDLVKWLENVTAGADNTYGYGDVGTIYERDGSASWSNLRTVPNSHGNGMSYFAEDDFLYYTSDNTSGRYGPLTPGNPQFSDDFLGAQGGVPLNTNSAQFVAFSSQYASRADTASLSITGDIGIEAQLSPDSLPTAGNTMVIASKWDESGALRSYRFDLAAVSGYFGDSSDGSLTISTDTTEAPIDSVCTGTMDTFSLSATNASFAANQIIFIHQTQGTNAGTWQRNKIISYTAGTITLETALNANYTTGSQVRVVKQHSSVTVNLGVTYTVKAWNGSTGGIIGWICSGTTTISGTLSVNGGNSVVANGTSTSAGGVGGGFRGAQSIYSSTVQSGFNGEGTVAPSAQSPANNGNGGGGGIRPDDGGSGGGNANTGGLGIGEPGSPPGGIPSGTADLTTITFGGGGGGSVNGGTTSSERSGGGSGGGIVFITSTNLVVTGAITGDGGSSADSFWEGGGGAGGSILLKVQTATLGTSLIHAIGGIGGGTSVGGKKGGDGSVGRVHIDYYTSYTGTSLPTINSTQDNTLVTNTSYTLRLSLSSTGSNSEILTRPITSISTDTWQHVAVSWSASLKTASFSFAGISIGSTVGTLGAIHNNASTFQLAMSKNGGGTAANFYNGLMDEVRLWNTTRTQEQWVAGINTQIPVNSAGLAAYYQLNGDWLDATSNNNDLTPTNSPTFVTDVPFSSPTTRLDIDQSANTSGDTYTLLTAISEAAVDRKTFTPTKDPQKSIAVDIAAVGTGNWTLTVHDQYNNRITSKTVANASLHTGLFEFVFDDPWRPLIPNPYHFHLTSTVADGTVVTGTADDLETVNFVTYFGFLVNDDEFHPIARFLNFLVFGNERYIAKYEATIYEPNKIVLEAGFRVRCFAYWREYLAIGVTKGPLITDYDSGRIYFWDGIAPTFNYYVDVPEGGINAMLGTKGKLEVVAGYQLDMLEYLGGDTADKIKRIPKITPNVYAEVYPGAISMWKTLLRVGVAGNGSSTEVNKGVYTWGSLNVRYDKSLSYDFPPSTQNYTGTSLKVGAVNVIKQRLLFSWQDNTAFGVDYVLDTNAPFTSGTIEFVVDDLGAIWKQKSATTLIAGFQPLPTGGSVTIKYKPDDSSDWTSTLTEATPGVIQNRLVMGGSRYQQYQIAADFTATTTSPVLYNLTFETDILETEKKIS